MASLNKKTTTSGQTSRVKSAPAKKTKPEKPEILLRAEQEPDVCRLLQLFGVDTLNYDGRWRGRYTYKIVPQKMGDHYAILPQNTSLTTDHALKLSGKNHHNYTTRRHSYVTASLGFDDDTISGSQTGEISTNFGDFALFGGPSETTEKPAPEQKPEPEQATDEGVTVAEAERQPTEQEHEPTEMTQDADEKPKKQSGHRKLNFLGSTAPQHQIAEPGTKSPSVESVMPPPRKSVVQPTMEPLPDDSHTDQDHVTMF